MMKIQLSMLMLAALAFASTETDAAETGDVDVGAQLQDKADDWTDQG